MASSAVVSSEFEEMSTVTASSSRRVRELLALCFSVSVLNFFSSVRVVYFVSGCLEIDEYFSCFVIFGV